MTFLSLVMLFLARIFLTVIQERVIKTLSLKMLLFSLILELNLLVDYDTSMLKWYQEASDGDTMSIKMVTLAKSRGQLNVNYNSGILLEHRRIPAD